MATVTYQTENRAPGVYVHEIPRGDTPIQAIGTGIAGFLGETLAQRKKSDNVDNPDLTRFVNKPQLITNWSQFRRKFGGFNGGFDVEELQEFKDIRDKNKERENKRKKEFKLAYARHFRQHNFLAHAVQGFFVNGGTRCYVNVVGTYKNYNEIRLNDLTSRGAENAPKTVAQNTAKPDPKDLSDKESSPVAEATKTPELKIHSSDWKVYQGEPGKPGDRKGLYGFQEIRDVDLIVAPGLVDRKWQEHLLNYCKENNKFAILDAPKDIDGDLESFKKEARPETKDEGAYGAIYFPWLQVSNPVSDTVEYAPPSGFVAGAYAKTDRERGTHKAPANTKLFGVIRPKYALADNEIGMLNTSGINCIQHFEGSGNLIWGARTLADESSSEWKYVNVRRLFLMVEETLKRRTQWVVFEPNNRELWMRITRSVTSFLRRLWREGALVGETPEQAFYVKCDEETNPIETQDEGMVIIEIGLAPVKPAEFVIFQLTQWAGPEEEPEGEEEGVGEGGGDGEA